VTGTGWYIYLPVPVELPLEDQRVAQFRRHLPKLEAYFETSPIRVYGLRTIQNTIREHRPAWRLLTLPISLILELLLEESRLVRIDLDSEAYGSERRYAWGTPSPLDLAQSLRAGAYLSHGTAAYIHGLLPEFRSTFYVNKEQSPKEASGSLTQESLDRAFEGQARESKLIFSDHERRRYVIISGKFTNKLAVSETVGPNRERVAVTTIERTLIDITVRPLYAGGLDNVLMAWRSARSKISVPLLMDTLKRLGYLYPYHQAVGFYFERAGYDADARDLARSPGLEFDFYLAHGIKDKTYSKEWRLYYPQGF